MCITTHNSIMKRKGLISRQLATSLESLISDNDKAVANWDFFYDLV